MSFSGWRPALRRLRRRCCESVGIARYSRPALHDLDRKLERWLDIRGGFFVEAGANDGFTQSNTYFFEKLRGWTGLLVEPVPALAAECRRNRRGPVIEAALVDREIPGQTIELHFAGLMSIVAGALPDAAAVAAHVARGLAVQNLRESYRCTVPARTLSSLLDEQRITRPIDLLSLDVEGAEVAALGGLDLSRHAPRFICVESRAAEELTAVLGDRFELVEVLVELGERRDLLFRRRSP